MFRISRPRRRDLSQAFRNNRQLQPFFLTDVTPTGKLLGNGAYGSVEEVVYQCRICAGKKLHDTLIDAENEGADRVVHKYLQECQLMSNLRHPNITQFLGLCFLPGTQLPLLIMERLESNLDDLLEHVHGLPISFKRSVLEDVASGLLYLHKMQPPVIHRDLTSKNVLLTSSLVAKITDMGNSRITSIRVIQLAQTLSSFPGALLYMPPEARNEGKSHYGPALDVFSFGHLALFTITQKFPCDLLPTTYPNPDNPDEVQGRTELECRRVYIDLLESQANSSYPALVQLVKQCLHNVPQQRPSTEECLTTLQRMKVEVEGEYGSSPVRVDMVRVRLAKEMKRKDNQIRELTEQQERQDAECEVMIREVDGLRTRMQVSNRQNQQLQEQIQTQNTEIAAKSSQIHDQQNTLQMLAAQLEELRVNLQRRETQLREEQQGKAAEIKRLKEEHIRRLKEEQSRCENLQTERETQLREKLRNREAEIRILGESYMRPKEEIQKKQLTEEEQQEWERNLCKFRVFMRHPTTGDMVERKIEVHKDKSLHDATVEAYKYLGLIRLVPLERCRLVKFDEYAEALDQSFNDTQQDLSFGYHVGGARSYFMEIRSEEEKFKVYNKGGLNLKVLIIDLPKEAVREPVQFRAERGWTVGELKVAIALHFELDSSIMNIALETYQSEGKQLTSVGQTLKSEGFFRKHTVFVCCDAVDLKRNFQVSAMNRVIDKCVNAINLFITVPLPPANPKLHPDGTQVTNQPQVYGPHETFDVIDDGRSKGDRRSSLEGETEDVTRPLQRTITIQIDRRKTLSDLKKKLESIVLLPATEFKIYRVYSNNQEYEVFRLQDSLQSVPNETKMIVRLGRALLSGEFRIKLSLLHINEVEYFKSIMDSIVAKGMTVRELKERLVKEAYEQGIEFSLHVDRIRLRKKTWRSPGTIFLDQQIFEKDIHVFANYEMFIEPLEREDPMKHATQIQVYVRHWHPSTHTVDKTQEIILDDNTPGHLKQKLAEFIGIPTNRVQFAKALGPFPSEISLLDLEGNLEWNPDVSTISSSPLAIYDDGAILYFKDSEEHITELSTECKAEIQKQENARLSKYKMTPHSKKI